LPLYVITSKVELVDRKPERWQTLAELLPDQPAMMSEPPPAGAWTMTRTGFLDSLQGPVRAHD